MDQDAVFWGIWSTLKLLWNIWVTIIQKKKKYNLKLENLRDFCSSQMLEIWMKKDSCIFMHRVNFKARCFLRSFRKKKNPPNTMKRAQLLQKYVCSRALWQVRAPPSLPRGHASFQRKIWPERIVMSQCCSQKGAAGQGQLCWARGHCGAKKAPRLSALLHHISCSPSRARCSPSCLQQQRWWKLWAGLRLWLEEQDTCLK